LLSRKLFLTLAFIAALHAETGREAWLRFSPVPSTTPAYVVALGQDPIVATAQNELITGIRGITGLLPRSSTQLPNEPAIVVGTLADLQQTFPLQPPQLTGDGYWLKTTQLHGIEYTLITAPTAPGALYGAFALLRKLSFREPIRPLDEHNSPAVPLRWVNQWDNLDGFIERGYGGRSLFWDAGYVREDLTRASEYARLLASVGLNACAINNVNANPLILSPAFIPQIKRIAAAMRPWGVKVAISVDFGSPKSVGGLDTFDPLDPAVARFWKSATDALYAEVPDLAGFVLKADSEGRVGPSFYKRTHADAANVVARALANHQGVLFYRGFVYDHHMDWLNPKNDRARAADDNFRPLDGQFDPNVIVQIKNGPIDFQVREPVSPLFGTLRKTRQALELQITQEYLGQGRHVVFLPPQWREVLDFDVRGPVRNLLGAVVGVSNVGLDDTWYGSVMSQANLYGFGRLAWDPTLAPAKIADEWTRLTFGNDPTVVSTITSIQLNSWRAYENYTGPLGLQTLTDIVGNHYGVAIEASENNGWGQWHRADATGVGMDRSTATGTGYAGQYQPKVAAQFESPKTTPDDLLLFFHHVPYTYVLHNGKTVIQYIYDSHYEGAAEAQRFADQWRPLRGKIDDVRYLAIQAQLNYQAARAEVWRDAVCNYFNRLSSIPDQKGRVGHHPGRIEAESAHLDGYVPVDITPWEAASGGKAISCPAKQCSMTVTYNGSPGWHTLNVQYFDQNTGNAHYRVFVGAQQIDEWTANDHVPTRKLDGSSSARREIHGIALRPGDQIRIEGNPDGQETAALDYIEIK
jgi:alpha-glucuronidase